MDSLRATAPQAVADCILIPCAIGWLAQIFLGGIACVRCLPALKGTIAIPFARKLLTAAVVCNLLSVLDTAWAVTAYIVVQERSSKELNNMKIPDVIAPAPAFIVTIATQAFMAYRYWRIIGRSKLFLLVVGLGEMAAAGSVVWGIVINGECFRHALLIMPMFNHRILILRRPLPHWQDPISRHLRSHPDMDMAKRIHRLSDYCRLHLQLGQSEEEGYRQEAGSNRDHT